MIEKRVNTIDELVIEVEKIRNEIKDIQVPESPTPSKLLFRGQSNAKWNLDTTLERSNSNNLFVDEYNALMWAIEPAISTFTGKKWNLERFDSKKGYFNEPPSYELMVYVRHHGFPSPLLDWSQSLYVSLFFAFRHASNNDVSIFIYVERMFGTKAIIIGDPEICELGPYINTHKRHFLQQGQYTIAVKKEHDLWKYCSHEDIFSKSNDPTQDVLYKFILPSSIKENVLNKLFEMNINAYTLFSNEEALMEMLAFKELKNMLKY